MGESLESLADESAGSDALLVLDELHPLIKDAVTDSWTRHDYPEAVRRGWFALRDAIRDKLGRQDLDGEALVNAIGETGADPALPLTDYSTETERNMHRGIVQMLRGLVFYARHPGAHEAHSPIAQDRAQAAECLAAMSTCARFVTEAAPPSVVDDALGDLMEPRFPTSVAALDDLVRGIPRRRLAEFLRKLTGEEVAAVEASDRALATKLHRAAARAYSYAGWAEDLVTEAAGHAAQLIARDPTLELGIRVVHGPVFSALELRYREKVSLALEDVARTGRLDDGDLRPDDLMLAVDLLPRLAPEARGRVVENLLEGIDHDDADRHGWAFGALMRGRRHLSEEEIERTASAAATALARTSSPVLRDFLMHIGKNRDQTGARVHDVLAGALRAQQGIEAPGSDLVKAALAAYEAPSHERADLSAEG